MRVLVVIGTRPEAIKLAPVVAALRQHANVEVRCCITAQHRELLNPLLTFFDIPRDYDLNVMRPKQTLADVTSRVVAGAAQILHDWPCDLVVVQGDTTSAFAAGLAAYYGRVPLAHVEAGLRSGNVAQPFPEEANRRFIDLVADYLFAPTPGARQNLLSEGCAAERITVTGNTGIDTLFLTRDRLIRDNYSPPLSLAPNARLCLVTSHRRESFGAPLRRIFTAVARLTDEHPSLQIVIPLHPNPQVRAAARVVSGSPRIHVTGPLAYPDFVALLLAADLIITDSGGVQEEAAALGKPILVTRETTERPEGVEAGFAELVGTDPKRILARAAALLTGSRRPRQSTELYGDGSAAVRISSILCRMSPVARKTA